MDGRLRMGAGIVRNIEVTRIVLREPSAIGSLMKPELVAELADEAQLKTAIRELRRLRKESEPLNCAWSDTRVARQRYEREYAFAVKQLQKKENQIMDELWPYLARIEELEKEVRKLDRKLRKAHSG